MRTRTSRLHAAQVDANKRLPTPPATFGSRELEGLPAPVQRYFRAALKDGQPIIAAVRLELAGTVTTLTYESSP